jgi:predicted NAD/FAD-binding protein
LFCVASSTRDIVALTTVFPRALCLHYLPNDLLRLQAILPHHKHQNNITMTASASKKTVAVVGTGISGLSAAWTLAQEGYAVTLFESEDRLGGHSLTYPGDEATNRPKVDLGFQVFNLTTYPYLTEFFQLLEVEHEPSDMSFALSVDGGRTEWSSLGGIKGVFAQRSNMASPSFLRMMREVQRFGVEAMAVLEPENADKYKSVTLGVYLDTNGYSTRFRKEYILPTMAAVWSVPNKLMCEFPVVPLVAFMANHHLLNPLGNRPRWRVVKGRSERYVDAVEEQLLSMGAEVRLNTRVSAVIKKELDSEQVQVRFEDDDKTETFDLVVMACHSDTTASLLQGKGCEADKTLVQRVHYQPNEVILHSDVSQMPVLKNAWASWNVLDKSNEDGQDDEDNRNICVTYWLNHLQNLPETAPLLLCTLNPFNTIDESKVIFRTTLDHPIYTTDAMNAQREINELQSDVKANRDRNVWFAGAWLGSGFHEDGIRSAIAVATGTYSINLYLPVSLISYC